MAELQIFPAGESRFIQGLAIPNEQLTANGLRLQPVYIQYKLELFGFLFFFHTDDFTALIMSAIGANRVRQPHFTALAALNQVNCLQCIM